jgi:hypothetical protein
LFLEVEREKERQGSDDDDDEKFSELQRNADEKIKLDGLKLAPKKEIRHAFNEESPPG